MNFTETPQGKALLSAYLKKFKGKGTERVYRSEIMQFFDFYQGDIASLSEDDFIRYRDHIGQSTAGTIKRKFSILNGFFRLAEKKIAGFRKPIGKTHGELKAFNHSVYAESDEFKNHLASLWKEERVTDSTRKVYENHIRLFFAWVSREPKELTQDDFIRYRDYLKTGKRKPSTIWNKFIALNRFFKLQASRNNRFKNPMVFKDLNLMIPKKDKGYYSILTEPEIRKLLKSPDRRSLIGKRDYAVLRLMLGYGLRVNEVCKLEYQDIEKERVNGKLRLWIRDRKGRVGRREDTPIILEGEPLRAFDDWIHSSGIRFAPDTKVFAPFIWDLKEHGLVIDYQKVDTGKRRDNKTFQNLLKKYLAKAGISRGDRVLSPHALRHTCFTMLARAGVNLPDIKKLAAHQDVATTLIYVDIAQSFDDHIGMKNPINKIAI